MKAITRERHTLKRTLTDPRILSGIGNAYSDEILHRARLSPFKLSTNLNDVEAENLYRSIVGVLGDWTERLRAEVGDGFPEKVTAFRSEIAVHGRFGQPCPDCGAAVQRIRYADTESESDEIRVYLCDLWAAAMLRCDDCDDPASSIQHPAAKPANPPDPQPTK